MCSWLANYLAIAMCVLIVSIMYIVCLNNSLPQEDCDKLLQAAKFGDVDVITAMFKYGIHVDAIVDNKVCT